MIIVQDKIVSDNVIEAIYLQSQCLQGRMLLGRRLGRPLEEAELPVLKAIFNDIKPFLSPAGIQEIERQGTAVWYEEAREWGTTLIDNGPCAYMTTNALGIAQCGIEAAWKAGVIDFKSRFPAICTRSA